MTAIAPKPIQPHRPLALTPEQWEEAKDRYMRGDTIVSIAKDLGCRTGTLESRITRAGLPKAKLDRLKDGRGERTKQKYAQISEEIADKLAGNAPKSLENLAIHADVAMKGVKVGSIVHGWGEQTNIAVIVAGDISGDPEPEAIDVETVSDGQQDEDKP